MYIPSPPVFAFISGNYKGYLDDTGPVLIIGYTENLLLKLGCLLVACCDGHFSYTFGYLKFDSHQSGFIVPLETGILADLHVVDQYAVVRSAGFHPVLSTLAMRHSL